MFNREMQIRLVKKNKNQQAAEPTEVTVEETVAIVNTLFDHMIKKISMAALGYVLIDTGRKVLVARASK